MKRYTFIAVLMALVCAVSCDHKELCPNHREHAHRYHVNIIADYRYDWEECCGGPDWKNDWPEDYIPYESLLPVKPGGLRVVNYDIDNNYNLHNISADGGVVTLYEGVNNILFYNNDTEYIIFSRTDNSVTTRATTRTRTRATYEPNKYGNPSEQTVTPPDMLYANYVEGYIAEKIIDPAPFEITLQPLVFTYKIRYEFEEGLEYVSQARGALTGMAREVELNTGETSEECATILFDESEITDWGVRAFVKSFGAPAFPHPNYPTRNEAKHGLSLEILMRNGKSKTFQFDVSEQVEAQPHGGVIVVSGIRIEREDVLTGSTGWEVEVDDWGEYEDVVLPL